MGAPRHILETALYADDLDAAERFYGNLLGLERVTRAGDRHVFFRCGDGMLLVFNASESVKPPANPATAIRCLPEATQAAPLMRCRMERDTAARLTTGIPGSMPYRSHSARCQRCK